MVFSTVVERFYLPKDAKLRVPYDGSVIDVDQIFDTQEIIPPYDVIGGRGHINGTNFLVGLALASGRHRDGNNEYYVCEPIRDSFVDHVRSKLEDYRKRGKLDDVEILVITGTPQI